MRIHSHLLTGALLAVLAAPASAVDLRLAAPGPNDQVARTLVTVDRKAATAHLERKAIGVSWALDAADALSPAPVPFVRESREFWRDASEAELRAGVRLSTTAPQALVRISPRGGALAALTTDDLVIRANGRQYSAAEATQSIADAAALRSAGMDVSEGTVVIKLAASIGSGDIELVAPSATGSYLVHVYEPTSTKVFTLGATRDTIVAGETLTVRAAFAGAKPTKASGVLSAPDGHVQNVDFAIAPDGTLTATVVPDPAHANGPALWEVHAFAEGRDGAQRVQRDARTAFAVSRPTARLDGRVAATTTKDGLRFDVAIDVASASRYQLAAVLYGRDADGRAKPLAYAQSAAWLDAGAGRVALQFDTAAIGTAKLTAPYELRDLRLTDQADMGLIERRERALELR